ncbi:MAG: hypothetical protein DRI95_03080 [Bacteroidetes bacterium]|nr:MAG: hypothetical protein DRI95_03080 [Bacteroidota bacterium]RLD73269.1 MAG: hypothetical protein DRJ07_21035 [Bacteroidota bacterium]
MLFDFYTKKIKVFVSEVSEDVLHLKSLLEKVLERAGMEVLCLESTDLKNEDQIIYRTNELIDAADCSIHLLGRSQINIELKKENTFLQDFQFVSAQKKSNLNGSSYKVFIWHPEFISKKEIHENQDEFIRSVRQRIHHNMIFSNRDSVISFVEDIRAVMYTGKTNKYDIEDADLFFIYNELDEDSSNEIIDMVADVIEVKKIEITLSDDVDYSELVVQQIKKSKMVVVYYKYASDWALPFVQQVWKKVGGASSNVPILFIGDSNIKDNQLINFEAPKVISQVVSQELIPIEIKVQFDKVLK